MPSSRICINVFYSFQEFASLSGINPEFIFSMARIWGLAPNFQALTPIYPIDI
jgi:hypothetical protein|tara:strand:- start:1719 stop:1877 length:159 start_codon:yes stop_codon:yes gene_type:complete